MLDGSTLKLIHCILFYLSYCIEIILLGYISVKEYEDELSVGIGGT